jgi:hypothetical protein
MAMKAAKVILVVLVVGALIGWVRQENSVGHIVRCLPFCGGHKPAIYDFGGLVLLGLVLWGLSRLKNAGKGGTADEDSASEAAHEIDQAEDEPADSPESTDGDHADQESSQRFP